MSVILDALKRVQAEDQRREETPERQDPRPQGGDDALVRRLAEPRSERPDQRRRGRGVSPVVWASLAVIAVVGAVALGLWWMAPSFEGPNTNEDRPLLADLTGPANGAAQDSDAARGDGVPSANGADRASGRDAAGGDGGNAPAGGGGEPPYTAGAAAAATPLPESAAAGQGDQDETSGEATDTTARQQRRGDATPSYDPDEPAPIWAPPRGADLSDLSGNVDRATEPDGDSRGDGEGFLSFEVADEDGRDSRQSPGVEIDSAGGAVEGQGRSTVPGRLVDPGVRDAFQEGVRLHQAGDFVRAEKAYKRALKFDPHNARVNLNLGVLYEQKDEFVLAERHLRQAVAMEPDHANSHNNLGVVLYRMGNYDAALIEFNRALALDPELLDAYTNKGLIFTRWGRYEDAERAFLQVLSLEPDHALSHYNLGLVYEETGQLEKAIQRYRTFLRLGASDYPDVTAYLSGHLDWLEGGRGTNRAVRFDQ